MLDFLYTFYLLGFIGWWVVSIYIGSMAFFIEITSWLHEGGDSDEDSYTYYDFSKIPFFTMWHKFKKDILGFGAKAFSDSQGVELYTTLAMIRNVAFSLLWPAWLVYRLLYVHFYKKHSAMEDKIKLLEKKLEEKND